MENIGEDREKQKASYLKLGKHLMEGKGELDEKHENDFNIMLACCTLQDDIGLSKNGYVYETEVVDTGRHKARRECLQPADI